MSDETFDVDAWLSADPKNWDDHASDWGYALCEAYDGCHGSLSRAKVIAADLGIAQVLRTVEGQNDEADWLAVLLLKDGRYAFLKAGCDYTGWDCRASGGIEYAGSLEELCRMHMGSEDRVRLGYDVFGNDSEQADCDKPDEDETESCVDPEPEQTGPVVTSQGLDLNRYALEHILPGAAQLCEEGRLREIAAERDKPAFERKVFWAIETRPGIFETTSKLPHGLPPLRVEGNPDRFHWAYVQAMQKYRVARGEAARKIARETVFMVAGKA